MPAFAFWGMLRLKIEDILARRSVSPRRLVEPGPDQFQIEALIAAACSAPDHRRLRPWRFVQIARESRARLADLFEAGALEKHVTLGKDGIERAREKAFNGACLIAVIARIRTDVPDVPAHEQWVSVGAALQNILLGAMALGFGGMIVSGDKIASFALQNGLGVRPEELLLGFVAIGTPAKVPSPNSRASVNEVLTVWTGAPAGTAIETG
jgi:nitroreductase